MSYIEEKFERYQLRQWTLFNEPFWKPSTWQCQVAALLWFIPFRRVSNNFEKNTNKLHCNNQARRHGGIPGSCPPNDCFCPPPSEDCGSKKLTDLGLLECKSRPKTPKLLFTALEFVSKNCFSVIFVNLHQNSFKFWDEDLFFLVVTSEFEENRKNFETTTRICGNFETKTFF